MKFFDTVEVRSAETLSPEQIAFLRKPSLTVFGPFNIIVRRHWDLLFAVLVLNALDKIAMRGPDGVWLPGVLLFAVQIGIWWFAVRHGRRLAWNRNEWTDFDEFVRSERKWMPWGVAFFGIVVVVLVVAFVLGATGRL